MQLKLVVLLAFAAACSARYVTPDNYEFFVDVGKDYIQVTDGIGKQIKFVVGQYYGYTGPQTVQVQLYGYGVVPKVVKYLDQQATVEGVYQADILYQIFNTYIGQLDAIQYEKLINQIAIYVQQGQINPAVLYALQALFGQYEALNHFEQLQTVYQQLPYGKLFGQQQFGQEYDTLYQGVNQYGVGSYYPSKYTTYNQGIYGQYYGPYANQYKYGQYQYGYPQKSYGSYIGQLYGHTGYTSQYPEQQLDVPYGQYYGKSYQYGAEYPQQGVFGGNYGHHTTGSYQYGSQFPQKFYGQYQKAYNY